MCVNALSLIGFPCSTIGCQRTSGKILRALKGGTLALGGLPTGTGRDSALSLPPFNLAEFLRLSLGRPSCLGSLRVFVFLHSAALLILDSLSRARLSPGVGLLPFYCPPMVACFRCLLCVAALPSSIYMTFILTRKLILLSPFAGPFKLHPRVSPGSCPLICFTGGFKAFSIAYFSRNFSLWLSFSPSPPSAPPCDDINLRSRGRCFASPPFTFTQAVIYTLPSDRYVSPTVFPQPSVWGC